MSDLSSLDGLLALWRRVIDSADDELRAQFATATGDFDRLAASIGLADSETFQRVMEEGRRTLAASGVAVRKPMRRAIEHGVAMFKSLERLKGCVGRYGSLATADPSVRDLEEMEALLDLWVVYIQRFIEATVKFAHLAGAAVGIDSQTTDDKFKVWVERLSAIASLRQEAAHGNPNSVSGVNDESLWEPMILLGAARTQETLEAMLALDPDVLNARLETFSPMMKQLTVEHIGVANALCRELAER